MAAKAAPTLKLAQLRAVALRCGIARSGTKPVIHQRILDEAVPAFEQDEPVRVLSIDMGIRNLAYCMLEVPSKSKTKIPKAARLTSEKLKITAWRVQNVIPTPTREPKADQPLKGASKLAATLVGKKPGDEVETSVGNGLEMASEKESFSPAKLSALAYTFIRHEIMPLSPTHILIERQRFRSGSLPHVLEWTIRVNMLESMLYSVLCTFKAEGIWKGEVTPVAPGKVFPYWFPDDQGVPQETSLLTKGRKTANLNKLNKGRKIDLVRNWLEDESSIVLASDDAKETAKAYIGKWDRGNGLGKKRPAKVENEETERLVKLDDLADSLLQGVAWVHWQENKRITAQRGISALIEDLK
ncbi:hypothetical protein BP6252_12197 [Coleophoma cylindrospora]|uniref:Mitochondrial resolvase Ydc2 catalytic domain-containing protein n=1 Tax=Coleophoma cylindrospora TaxID=1849047 RepID=A0A3D8QHB8_9HELO|nr:hypothetical protein BP6252_12197 [Coleophoma cylindrospora]